MPVRVRGIKKIYVAALGSHSPARDREKALKSLIRKIDLNKNFNVKIFYFIILLFDSSYREKQVPKEL